MLNFISVNEYPTGSGYDCHYVNIVLQDWRINMYLEILFLAIPAMILLGLCNLTERSVTIRHSEGTRHKRTNPRFK
jgi:hypothetical protein